MVGASTSVTTRPLASTPLPGAGWTDPGGHVEVFDRFVRRELDCRSRATRPRRRRPARASAAVRPAAASARPPTRAIGDSSAVAKRTRGWSADRGRTARQPTKQHHRKARDTERAPLRRPARRHAATCALSSVTCHVSSRSSGASVKRHRFAVGVAQDQETVVVFPARRPPALACFRAAIAVEEHGKGPGVADAPVVVGHPCAGWRVPRDVGLGVTAVAPHGLTFEETTPTEDGMTVTQRRSAVRRRTAVRGRRRTSRATRSRCPGSTRCCCRRCVRPSSSPASSIGTPCDRNSVVNMARTRRARRSTMAWSLVGPSTPEFHERLWSLAVAVLLAVGLVVLVVVGDEIGKCEPVVGGDEIDAGGRATTRRSVQVGAAGEAVGEVGERLVCASPVVAHAVAVPAVPLRPQRREVADLVPALTEVPRLGDQLDPARSRDPAG